MSDGPIVALVFVNNAISREMAKAALARDGIALGQVALILMRKMPIEPWMRECQVILEYPVPASLTLLGQRAVAGYYWRAAALVRKLLKAETLREIYLVNYDNLLLNHVLCWARTRSSVRVTVLAEGLMNFQDIRARNRAWWRIWTKPVLASLLGLKWRTPTGHLSGAFEPEVQRVVSFSAEGLQAPPEKTVVIPFSPVAPQRPPRLDTLLYIETALWQWMSPADFEPFADAFASWIRAQSCSRLLIKPHPNYPASEYLRQQLPPYEIWGVGQSVEALAGEIDAATVVGTCCTGLVTLQMMRPDLRCVDFGADHYLPKAYYGNQDVLTLMRAAGIEFVDMHAKAQTAQAEVRVSNEPLSDQCCEV